MFKSIRNKIFLHFFFKGFKNVVAENLHSYRVINFNGKITVECKQSYEKHYSPLDTGFWFNKSFKTVDEAVETVYHRRHELAKNRRVERKGEILLKIAHDNAVYIPPKRSK